MPFSIENILAWVKLHPEYALLFTFIMAFGESLAFIGGFLPGTMAIIGMGVLAGTGLISIEWNLSVAIIGAICGDVVSFWIGHYYQSEFRTLYFFKKYPKILKYSEDFFEKNGGKSVFLARFLSPIRAVAPAIAGMMGMKFSHFIIANVLSAFGWCGLYFFSGVLVGMGHQHLPFHTRQFIISISLIIFIPMVLLKAPRTLKKGLGKLIGKKIEHFWENIHHQYQLIQWITPKNHIFTFFDTAIELIFILSLTIFYFIPDTYLSLLKDLWPYYDLRIFQHILNLNQPLHVMVIMSIFIVFCAITRNLQLFFSIAFTLILILGLNTYVTGKTPLFWMMSIALQWLYCRTHLVYKTAFFYPLVLLISTSWFASIIILSLNLKLPFLSYFFLSLLCAQMGWMVARKNIIVSKWQNIGLCILALENLMILWF
jgi:membrane protein DedA with SNARE-associated domain